jgi:predicted polyphosphate/ATP-dependent NAD kinase
MVPGRLYLLGPGTTVAHVSHALRLPASLLGVDAVMDGALVGSDLTESQLQSLLIEHPDAVLVLGVVGGQGFLLGRGNQQLSPAVIAAVGTENIVVLAAAGKIAAAPYSRSLRNSGTGKDDCDPPVHAELGAGHTRRDDAGTRNHRRRRAVRADPGRSSADEADRA